METNVLVLKTYVDGVNDTPFPQDADSPIEIGAFRYDAKRMGGAPIITASVNYPSCLDSKWTNKVYAEFNGEKYFLKQTPTSSYDNQDSMYKHEVELVSERVILDNVYFYDAVVSSEKETSPIIGNPPARPEWQYFGNIDISKDYTTFSVRQANDFLMGIFDVVFDEAIRIVSGPPIDMRVESATGDIYVYDNYGYIQAVGLNLVFSYIDYDDDKPVSNSTKVVFFGNIREFASRLQSSLEYSGLDYTVVVDDEVISEEKLMSFEDQFFSNVLQEIYNQYQIPYYFEGKTIHIGFSVDVYPQTFSYGVDDALISITKNNANYKVVNRVTGKGSTDNIPYYYPNNSPKGEVELELNTTSDDFEVSISDMATFSDKVKPNTAISFIDDYKPAFNGETLSESKLFRFTSSEQEGKSTSHFEIRNDETVKDLALYFTLDMRNIRYYHRLWFDEGDGETATTWDEWVEQPLSSIDGRVIVNINGKDVYNDIYSPNDVLEFNSFSHDVSHIKVTFISYGVPIEIEGVYGETYGEQLCEGDIKITYNFFRKSESELYWSYNGRKVDLQDLGLSAVGDPNIGDTITQRLVKFVNTSQNLMPSVYRHSDGKERFYNAINYPYPKYEGFDETLVEDYYGEDGIQRNALGEYEIDGMIHNDAYKEADGEYIRFKNPYFEGTPKEHAISVEDLKPTIKEAVNSMGLRMDMFSEFAYDLDDNDETEENEDGTDRDFIHSYFFGKLRKLDFNLFEHAIEHQPMTISFTSGNCGACNFEIGVTEEFPQKNPVLVNADGSLKRDEKGRVICGQFQEITEDEIQDEQQDTSKNEVWIALKKEESTYGILMPKATIKEEDAEGNIIEVGGHQPKACTVNEDGTANNDGDTFVILGINLPDSYISNAEDKLRDEIIKYIKENNVEKFNFSITFSRIYFAENPDVLQFLNENSRLNVEYNGKTYTLYVTSYSYNMGEGDVLPEIKVELDDKLTLSQNALQNAINEVKSEVNMAFANFDVLAFASPYFLRKDTDDICNGKIDFKKGIKFGEGGKVEVLDNNSAKLTIEYLEVTKKASFTSLEIKEKTHVGGQIIISPAAMTCGEVEELENAYRCYFQTKNAEGNDEIFNQFAENDLAICQTYNAWGSRYYWRKVVGVGEDYIDLSKTLCDEYSDVPMIGDKIIQLGNTIDITRQSAIVLSAYGDNAPSFIMYNGINDFTLVDKNITGIIWNPKTLEPQMYSYGSFFFGDGTTDENGNLVGEDFITFQKRDGDTKKKLHINATVNFSSDSTGLSNLEEWKEVEKDILNLNKTVEQVQDQIDGVIENWSGDYTPTIKNMPVSDWLAKGNDELVAHINDTFINISDGEDSGKAWRWCECFELDKFIQVDEIYNDIIPSREWYKIGTLDKEAGYTSYSAHGTSGGIVYDTNIQIISGTPTYVRFESATNDIYVLDADGYFESQSLSVKVSYSNFIQVTLQDGSPKFLHWHPIADTDAINALKEAAEAKYMVNDLAFLKDTFKKGTTTIENGVVMTQMVAVGESGENVEAFLNGSEDFSDADRGKMILAGGVPEGTEDIKERAKEALTRIYEDGTIETERLIANQGKIAGFNLKKDSFSVNIEEKNEETGAVVRTQSTEVSPHKISIHGTANYPYEEGYKSQVDLFPAVASYTAFSGIIRHELLNAKSDDFGLIKDCCALILSAKGALPINNKGFGGNFAIKAENGMFAGLRPRTRTIVSSSGLTKLDHTIMVVSTSALTLTLPDNPEIGQEYDIYFAHQTEVNFPLKSNDISIHWPVADIWGVKQTNITGKGVVKIICASDQNGSKLWWVYRLV